MTPDKDWATPDKDWATVEKAAKTIDMLDFDRWAKVDIEKLDMGSMENCLLGQMYAEDYRNNPNRHVCNNPYSYALKELGISPVDSFTFGKYQQKAWLIEVKKRLL